MHMPFSLLSDVHCVQIFAANSLQNLLLWSINNIVVLETLLAQYLCIRKLVDSLYRDGNDTCAYSAHT